MIIITTIIIALMDFDSICPATKIGSLFINPGGPGSTASELLAGLVEGSFELPSDLFDAFGIIGVDTRGIALSHKVECDQNIFAERISWFP